MAFSLPTKEPNILSSGIFKTDAFSRNRLIKVNRKFNGKSKSFFVKNLQEAYAIKEKVSIDDINPKYLANLISIFPSKDISPYKQIEYLPSTSYITLKNNEVEKK